MPLAFLHLHHRIVKWSEVGEEEGNEETLCDRQGETIHLRFPGNVRRTRERLKCMVVCFRHDSRFISQIRKLRSCNPSPHPLPASSSLQHFWLHTVPSAFIRRRQHESWFILGITSLLCSYLVQMVTDASKVEIIVSIRNKITLATRHFRSFL